MAQTFEANCTDTNCLVAILVPISVIAFVLLIGVVMLAWPIDKKALAEDCDRRAREEEEFAELQRIEFRRKMAESHAVTWEAEGQIQSVSAMSPITGESNQSSPIFPNVVGTAGNKSYPKEE